MADEKTASTVETARINAVQAIAVALITGIVSVIGTLAASGKLTTHPNQDTGRPPIQTTMEAPDRTGARKADLPVLRAPRLMFLGKQSDLGLAECMKRSKVAADGVGLTGQKDEGYYRFGYVGGTIAFVWCHADAKQTIFIASGPDADEATKIVTALERLF